MEPVVVTGLGVVSSLGIGWTTFWENLLQGKSGISQVTGFDTSALKVHRGGEINDYNGAEFFTEKDLKRTGRTTQFAIHAARLALADASIKDGDFDPKRTSVCVGTTSGEAYQVERLNDLHVSNQSRQLGADFITQYPGHCIAGAIVRDTGFTGAAPLMLPAACAAGNYAIAQAFDAIRSGRMDVVLAGGADAFSRIIYTGFARLMAISPELCSPFDLHRKGMIPGEGAGFLVLESLRHCRARKAQVYAEIAGYGITCDAHHMTASHPQCRGAVKAMKTALDTSAVDPADIDYISAHGTGTRSNDSSESKSVGIVFGKDAGAIPMSSIKSMIGHTMGAASAIEAAVCALAIRFGKIPPTMNLLTPDPDCPLDYVPNQARAVEVKVAMNNAYAFGGTNASVVMKAASDAG